MTVAALNGRHFGFLPWQSLYFGLLPGHKDEGNLKIASLIYDHIIIPVRENGFRAVFASEEKIPYEQVTDAWRFLDEIAPEIETTLVIDPPEELIFDESGKWRRRFRKHIDNAILDEWRDQLLTGLTREQFNAVEAVNREDKLRLRLQEIKRNEPYQYAREGHAILKTAIGSALVWSQLSELKETSFVAFHEIEFEAARSFLANVAPLPLNAMDIVVPSVRALDWRSVFDFRRDKRVTSFRNWFWKVVSKGTGNELRDEIIGELLNAAMQYMPNLITESVLGIAGNVPVPIVNPVSLINAGASIRKAHKAQRDHGWLIFLHKLRNTGCQL